MTDTHTIGDYDAVELTAADIDSSSILYRVTSSQIMLVHNLSHEATPNRKNGVRKNWTNANKNDYGRRKRPRRTNRTFTHAQGAF